MTENLLEPASVQYDRWVGTVAADDIDMTNLAERIGVNREAWDLVVVDLHVDGGYQTITGWGVPSEEAAYETRRAHLQSSGGVLEVTRLVEHNEEPHEHADTNPPTPPKLPLTWASEVVALGFKRLHIRIIDVQDDFRDQLVEIREVASLIGQE